MYSVMPTKSCNHSDMETEDDMGKFYKSDGYEKTTWKHNVSAGMRRSAADRRCPKCGRGGALKRDSNIAIGTAVYCRWPECGYERVNEPIRG